jgi:hypothetical protein
MVYNVDISYNTKTGGGAMDGGPTVDQHRTTESVADKQPRQKLDSNS